MAENLGAYVAGVAAEVIRENNGKLEQRMRELISQIDGARLGQMFKFGNPTYLCGEVVVTAGATGDVVMKASNSRDLAILSISVSQDGTPADRLDPWQSDGRITSFRFTSITKDEEWEHITDGEVMLGDLFGRDDTEQIHDVIKASQDVTMTFRNADPFNAHRFNVNMKCAFWPPILYGMKNVDEKNLFDLRPKA